MTILCCCVTPIHHHRHSSSSLSTTLLLPLPLYFSLFSLHPYPHHDHSILLCPPYPSPPPLFLIIINNSSPSSSFSYSSFLLGSTSFFSSSSNHDNSRRAFLTTLWSADVSRAGNPAKVFFVLRTPPPPPPPLPIRHVWRNMNANSFSQTSAYTKETWCAKQGKRMAGWKLKKMLRGCPIFGAFRWTPILISDFCQVEDVELLTGDFGHFADCPPVWPCTSLPRACSGQKQVGRDWKVAQKGGNLCARTKRRDAWNTKRRVVGWSEKRGREAKIAN